MPVAHYSTHPTMKFLLSMPEEPRAFIIEYFKRSRLDAISVDYRLRIAPDELPTPDQVENHRIAELYARIANLESELAELRQLTPEQVAAREAQWLDADIDRLRSQWKGHQAKLDAFLQHLAAIQSWEAPDGLRHFRAQLIRDLKQSCDFDAVAEAAHSLAVREEFNQVQRFVSVRISAIEREIEMYRKLVVEYQEELQHVRRELAILHECLADLPEKAISNTLYVGRGAVPSTVSDVSESMLYRPMIAIGAMPITHPHPTMHSIGLQLLKQTATYWIQLVENHNVPFCDSHGRFSYAPSNKRVIVPRAFTADDIRALATAIGTTPKEEAEADRTAVLRNSCTAVAVAKNWLYERVSEAPIQVLVELPSSENGVGVGVYDTPSGGRWIGLFEGRDAYTSGTRLDHLHQQMADGSCSLLVKLGIPVIHSWKSDTYRKIADAWMQAIDSPEA